MRTLIVLSFVVGMSLGITGCGNSDRARFEDAIEQVVADKAEKAHEMDRFDKMSKEEQAKTADYAEYFAILKKTSGGALDDRMIKKTVSKTFEGKDAVERAQFLKKVRAEMKKAK